MYETVPSCNISLIFATSIIIYIFSSFLYGLFSLKKYIDNEPFTKVYNLIIIFLINAIFMPISIIRTIYLVDKYNLLYTPIKKKKRNILFFFIKILGYDNET